MRSVLRHVAFLMALTIFVAHNRTFAQTEKNIEKVFRDSSELFGNCLSDSIPTFHFVNHPPSFKGDFGKFINSHIDKNKLFLDKTAEIKMDSVFVKFLVAKNGSLCRFRFVNSPTESLKQLIVKVFLSTPNWQPGTHDGGRFLNTYSQMLIIITTNLKTRSIHTNIHEIKDRVL